MTEDNDTDDVQPIAWARQTPTTRIAGRPTGLAYPGNLDPRESQNDDTIGVVLEDVEVITGTLFRNAARDDDTGMAEQTPQDEPRPTDYRIADEDDGSSTIVKGSLTTGENGPSVYDPVEEVTDDEVIVWYSGMSAQRIARALDFNGRPFANWTVTQDGSDYLVKGLFQVPDGWRDADGGKRKEFVDNGKAPRFARYPTLRYRVNEEGELLDDFEAPTLLFDISRWRGGRGYEAHVFDADHFEAEAGGIDAEMLRNDDGYVDMDSEVSMQFHDNADEVLNAIAEGVESDAVESGEDLMSIHYDDGWETRPDGVSSASGSTSFSVETSAPDTNEAGFTASQEAFLDSTVDALSGTGLSPREAFDGGIDGLIQQHADGFDVIPDAEAIEETLYERVTHLDPDDLEAAEA